MTTKCKCQHCSEHISFDSTQKNSTAICPHCGLETILYDPPRQNLGSPTPFPPARPSFFLPPVKAPIIAQILVVFAGLNFVGAVILGVVVGAENGIEGLAIFVGGFLAGFILLGYASLIKYTSDSAQRLHRMEILMLLTNVKANAELSAEQKAVLSREFAEASTPQIPSKTK